MSQSERRQPPRPLLGVGAILFRPDLSQVLLIKRRNPPSAGFWTFPGGLVHTGETARQAAQRELAEETGLRVELAELAVIAERIIREPGPVVAYHYLILDFWGLAPADAVPAAQSDAAAARFVPLTALDELQLTRGVVEAVQVALALARGERPAPVMLEER